MNGTILPTTQDFSSLVGKSYDRANCWDIIREFYLKCFNVELKQYYQDYTGDRKQTESLIQTNSGDFEKVEYTSFEQLKFGDLVVIKIHGLESHVGAICGMAKLFHSTQKTGSIIEPVEKWKTCIAGVYRLKGMA